LPSSSVGGTHSKAIASPATAAPSIGADPSFAPSALASKIDTQLGTSAAGSYIDSAGKLVYDDKGNPVYKKDKAGNVLYFDGWKPDIPLVDEKVDFAKYGYKSLDELVRWRLYNRTGAGLMAELGSHQLDACSIFLGKKHPLSVTGIGGTFFYTDGREVDDHVFVNFEFPGKAENDRTVVTYSSINTNAFENYGEELMGSRGTMIVEGEKEMLLYKEPDRNTYKE